MDIGLHSPQAQRQVKDDKGALANVTYRQETAYPPFRLDETSPIVVRAKRALETLGIEPNPVFSNGGLDANWLDKHGIPTVTIAAGQAEIHTIHEYVNIPDFVTGCRIALLLATDEA